MFWSNQNPYLHTGRIRSEHAEYQSKNNLCLKNLLTKVMIKSRCVKYILTLIFKENVKLNFIRSDPSHFSWVRSVSGFFFRGSDLDPVFLGVRIRLQKLYRDCYAPSVLGREAWVYGWGNIAEGGREAIKDDFLFCGK